MFFSTDSGIPCLFVLPLSILQYYTFFKTFFLSHLQSFLLPSPPGGISSSLYPSGTFPGLCPVPCSCSPLSLSRILTPSSPLHPPFFPLFAISIHSKKVFKNNKKTFGPLGCNQVATSVTVKTNQFTSAKNLQSLKQPLDEDYRS